LALDIADLVHECVGHISAQTVRELGAHTKRRERLQILDSDHDLVSFAWKILSLGQTKLDYEINDLPVRTAWERIGGLNEF
jgi:hypothetical protein